MQEPGDWNLRQNLCRNAFCWLAHPASLYNPGSLPKDSTTYNSLGPPTSIINQDNNPTDLPTDSSHRGLFSIEIISSEMTLDCAKLTKWTSTLGHV